MLIRITEPPIVEIDTEATAAYVRLSNAKVARTSSGDCRDGLLNFDWDGEGQVVGIEIIGQREFSIRELIRGLPVEAADDILNQTRYVTAKLEIA